MLGATTQVIAVRLAENNPELAQAAPERIEKKAAGVIVASIWGIIALLLLFGACVFDWYFAKEAIAQHREISLTLVATFILPFGLPVAAGMYATTRLDPDAGGIFAHAANFASALWKSRTAGGHA